MAVTVRPAAVPMPRRRRWPAAARKSTLRAGPATRRAAGGGSGRADYDDDDDDDFGPPQGRAARRGWTTLCVCVCVCAAKTARRQLIKGDRCRLNARGGVGRRAAAKKDERRLEDGGGGGGGGRLAYIKYIDRGAGSLSRLSFWPSFFLLFSAAARPSDRVSVSVPRVLLYNTRARTISFSRDQIKTPSLFSFFFFTTHIYIYAHTRYEQLLGRRVFYNALRRGTAGQTRTRKRAPRACPPTRLFSFNNVDIFKCLARRPASCLPAAGFTRNPRGRNGSDCRSARTGHTLMAVIFSYYYLPVNRQLHYIDGWSSGVPCLWNFVDFGDW